MNPDRSDALVLFGATGDLAFKKIFPALYAMTVRDQLSTPVIGVARSGWTLVGARLSGSYWSAILAHKAPREEAASRIAQRYRAWAAIFERAYSSRASSLCNAAEPPPLDATQGDCHDVINAPHA